MNYCQQCAGQQAYLGRCRAVQETSDGSIVLAIVADGLVRCLPGKCDVAARLREGCPVVGDGCLVTVNQQTGLVRSIKKGEQGPFLISAGMRE